MISLWLCGDVMLGRGIDQALPHSVDPRLFESHVHSAETYVDLAEHVSGPIPRGVAPEYVWGSALADLNRLAPDVRIGNLETAVTTSDDACAGKEVLYRTHPANVAVLAAARIDCCTLANNHVLDWGRAGLAETLASVRGAGVATVGAGRDRESAEEPAAMARVIVVGFASTSSGVPAGWAATDASPGVALVNGWSPDVADALAARLGPIRRPGDVVVASVHWGSNWGYGVPEPQRRLAHRLIEVAGVDVVHGHSSHHPRPIELHRGRLILYGCGDLITDYEGIAGHEEFRNDLVLAYLVRLDAATGALERLILLPYRLRRFRLEPPSEADAAWLRATLDRHCRPFGVRVDPGPDGTFEVYRS